MFRERGTRALLAVDGYATPLDEPPRLASPVPVLAKPGDVLLAHYLLGRNTGGDLTNHPRRALYFRLTCVGHADLWERTFLDAFAEVAPHRDLVELPDG